MDTERTGRQRLPKEALGWIQHPFTDPFLFVPSIDIIGSEALWTGTSNQVILFNKKFQVTSYTRPLFLSLEDGDDDNDDDGNDDDNNDSNHGCPWCFLLTQTIRPERDRLLLFSLLTLTLA